MARPIQITFPAADRDGICLAQTRTGAGPLIINGALKDLAATMQNVTQAVLGTAIQRPVTVYSAGDLSLVAFTITGVDVNGAAVSETIATGPNNSTVATTALYAIVTGVATSATIGTAAEVGTGTTGNTRWLMTNVNISPANLSVSVAVTATASVTVQQTPDDVQTVASPTTFNHPTLAAITGSADGNYAYPPRYVRAVMNSSSGSGAFTATFIQAGIA